VQCSDSQLLTTKKTNTELLKKIQETHDAIIPVTQPAVSTVTECLCLVQKPENTPDVVVGDLIALIVDSGTDWKNVAIPESATVSQAPPPTPGEADTSAPPTPVS